MGAQLDRGGNLEQEDTTMIPTLTLLTALRLAPLALHPHNPVSRHP